jgi:tRNA (guanosine-2'-O-)-methyltransferase
MQDTINQINFLKQFVSENRINRFDEVINQRTNYIQIVLENLYQAHNASAVLRSCESFGLQTVHFIENKNSLKISADVAMGSSNWLTINRYKDFENNTVHALTKLKQQGFKIVATTPHTNSYTIDALPINQKIALVFGTEIDGISKDVYNLADEFVKIPMYGFTESFNISVCAALCMYELTTRARKIIPNYLLTNNEKQEVYLNWLKTSVDKSSQLLNQHFKTV